MALTPGMRLGAYEVTAQIGEGGMGQVYRATDTRLKRQVAIKILPPSLAADPERMARFQREAEVLASLNHPNIAIIHGLEDADGVKALVMELVEGEDLSQRIARGAIPLAEALPVAKQIADALDAAHEQGIIHRDLKPANIKVRSDGTVKVLDFGLAKAMEPATALRASAGQALSQSPTITTPAMTQAGMILGTAAYMSPEQARGKTVDKRADIWAFGCVLFEMLTSRRAFAGEDVTDTIVSVISKEPDWPALPSSVSASVRALLRRCLEKDPRRRMRDIGEAWLQLDAPVIEVALVKKSGMMWPALVAACLAIAAAVLAWTSLRPASIPDVTRFEILGPSGTTLPLGTPAVSPDGRTIAFVAIDKQLMRHIYIRALDSVEARALPGTEGAYHPFFSPDGRSLAFATNKKLTRIDLAGGTPRVLADATGPYHGTWSQNGTILFVNRGLFQTSANGGTATQVSSGSHPYFLPDGQRFLSYFSTGFSTGEGNKTGKPRIELRTVGAKEGTLVLDDADSAAFIAPTPGGPTYMLYMRGSSVMAHQFDESAGKLVGEPAAILDHVGRVALPAVTPALGVSRSGTLAFQGTTSQGEGHLTWHDRAGRIISELPSQAVGSDPALSPDGQFVAVDRMDSSASTKNIWVADLKRGASSRLTFGKSSDRFPVWSPDGKRVTFTRDGVGVMEKDASGVGDETLFRPGIGRAYDWSPDGKFLIVAVGAGEAALVPGLANGTGGNKPIPVGSANGRSTSFQFSPDGKYIVYQSDESGPNEVYVQPTPPGTGRWQVSVNGGGQPRWRRDGKELFFRDSAGDIMAVDVTAGASFSRGTPRTLFRAGQAGLGGYSVSADGQRFLIYSDEAFEADSPIIVVQNWWAALHK